MPTIYADQLGATFTRAEDGDELRVLYKITGLTSAGWARLTEALALTTVPSMGEAHSELTNLSVSSVQLKAIDEKHIELEFIYTGRAGIDNDFGFGTSGTGDSIEVGASLISEEVNTDRDGNVISITYTNDDGVIHQQSGYINRFLPQITKSFAKRSSTQLGAFELSCVGKVNSDDWPRGGDLGGGNAGKWLCTGITSRSTDWGATWEHTYTFQYNADGWNTQDIVFIDPETGRPPADVTAENGITTVTAIYETTSFGGLQL